MQKRLVFFVFDNNKIETKQKRLVFFVFVFGRWKTKSGANRNFLPKRSKNKKKIKILNVFVWVSNCFLSKTKHTQRFLMMLVLFH